MIDEARTYAGLAEIFSDVFFRDDIVLSPRLTAKDVEGWDSYRQIEIIIATETKFRMKFTSMEIDRMQSLGELASIVMQRGSLI